MVIYTVIETWGNRADEIQIWPFTDPIAANLRWRFLIRRHFEDSGIDSEAVILEAQKLNCQFNHSDGFIALLAENVE